MSPILSQRTPGLSPVFRTLRLLAEGIFPIVPSTRNAPIRIALLISLIFISLQLLPCISEAQIAGELTRITVGQNGQEANNTTARSAISPSGALIAFESGANNLIAKDRNSAVDIFVASAATGKIVRGNLGRKRIEANGPSTAPRVSAQTPNGKYVLTYESDASNLVRNKSNRDDNGYQDIYVTAFPSYLTFKVSRAADGSATNARSESPDIALLAEPDRLFVVYSSRATNIVSDDTNSFFDIFLARITLPQEIADSYNPEGRIVTTRITRSSMSSSEPDGDSGAPRISGDGTTIVFESEATNLIAGVTTAGKQIFAYNLKDGSISLISKGADGTPGNATSRAPSVSYNGRYVTYLTVASNLVPDGVSFSKPTFQVLRYDRTNDLTERVNVTQEGATGNSNNPQLMTADIDASGRFIIFSDRATNLSDSDQNSAADIFIKDMETGILERVSKTQNGNSPEKASLFPAINRNSFTALKGLATFASAADDIVEQDTTGVEDLFRTSLTFSPLPVTAETALTVPPDISLGTRTAHLSFEQFSGVSSFTAASNESSGSALAATITPRVTYQITYHQQNSAGRTVARTKITAKRNTATIRNLKPGTYTVSYRVQVQSGRRITSRSKPSPSQRFTIQ